MAGFLAEPEEAEALVPAFLAPGTAEATRIRMVGTFRALEFYQPRLLPGLRVLIVDRIDQDAQFVAAYLAEHGDADARAAVATWLDDLDLGTWSSSRHSYLAPLAKHDDSRPAVARFLERSRGQGHLLIDGWDLRLLADAGDRRAREQLVRAAYRGGNGFGAGPIAGIQYLRTVDPDETFFAATRLLGRHADPSAIDLMLEVDREAALPILVERYGAAKPSLRQEIARRLRVHLNCGRFSALVTDLTRTEPRIAAELAGYVPPAQDLPWLEMLADDGAARVRETARKALRQRSREVAAVGHLEAMPHSTKPMKWVRLRAIFELVDPFFLWRRDDPASLQRFVDANPPEFLVEARRLRSSRIKELENEGKQADRKAE